MLQDDTSLVLLELVSATPKWPKAVIAGLWLLLEVFQNLRGLNFICCIRQM